MAANESFYAFVKELFAPMGEIKIKRMFGGAGGFRDGLMFLLLVQDVIHIKADTELKQELIAEGSGPFVWIPRNGPRAGEQMDLGYWRLPEAAIDDPDLAAEWGRKALAIARAKATAKPKGKAKKAAPKKKR